VIGVLVPPRHQGYQEPRRGAAGPKSTDPSSPLSARPGAITAARRAGRSPIVSILEPDVAENAQSGHFRCRWTTMKRRSHTRKVTTSPHCGALQVPTN
jgi:hypothetical protein